MEKVFIAGSRRLARLSKEVKKRIDNIVEKGFTVVVGDANGADKAVQQYLANKCYERVIVYCMAGNCRNKLGKWAVREIKAALGAKGFNYYSTKDRAMADDADYGLMLWDGKSRGTFENIAHLLKHEKPVLLYIAPEKSFLTLHEPNQLLPLAGRYHLGAPQLPSGTSQTRRLQSHPSGLLF